MTAMDMLARIQLGRVQRDLNFGRSTLVWCLLNGLRARLFRMFLLQMIYSQTVACQHGVLARNLDNWLVSLGLASRVRPRLLKAKPRCRSHSRIIDSQNAALAAGKVHFTYCAIFVLHQEGVKMLL